MKKKIHKLKRAVYQSVPNYTEAKVLILSRGSGKEKHLSFFQVLDLKTGKLSKPRKADLPEWSGLSAYRDGYLMAYSYPDPKLPKAEGIICLNEKGKLLWEDKSLKWEAFTRRGMICRKDGQTLHFSETGELLTDSEAPEPLRHFENAVLYEPGNPYFSDFQEFFSERYRTEISAKLFYLERESETALLYENTNGTPHFLLLDSTGEELFHEPLKAGDKKGAAFFVFRNVFFIIHNDFSEILIPVA